MERSQAQPGVVLVVDDDPGIRELLRGILESDGWRVEEAAMAPEAVLRLATQPYDLMLVDLNLPAVSGQALLRRARAMRPDMPVLVITGYPSVSVAVQVMKDGALDFLEKPFRAHQVLRAVHEASDRQKESRAQTLGIMNRATAVRDHAERVTSLSLLMAKALDYNTDAVKTLKGAGFLYDLGMLGIQDHVLQKTAPLTSEELEQIKEHPRVACQMAQPLGVGPKTLATIRHHHEHWDGSGYPDSLAGEQIPPLARLIHTADAYDAMTHPWPYNHRRSSGDALSEIQRQADDLFDPAMVQALSEVVAFHEASYQGGVGVAG